MKLTAQATLQIQKTVGEVFEAIVNPDHMTQYFLSESSGRLESGKNLTWKFPEFEDEFPVTQVSIQAPDLISFVWDPETTVNIFLRAEANKSTVVKVTEGNKIPDDKNMKWLISNTEGWANFLACLKAYLEYGVHLRKGAYDFMRK